VSRPQHNVILVIFEPIKSINSESNAIATNNPVIKKIGIT